MNFTKDTCQKILSGELDADVLARQYPQLNDMVMKDFSELSPTTSAEDITKMIQAYTSRASLAIDRISKNQGNQKTISMFLPDIIKARIAIRFLEQVNFAVQSGEYQGRVRFNLWDGMILQKLLFREAFVRKPVSIRKFKLVWPLIIKKKLLMPMVNKKGIYCFYSTELVKNIIKLANGRQILEIGAGDGSLTNHINELGGQCIATDNYSWNQYIDYPENVEKLDAKQALQKYSPEVVLCSWPPPNNSFEKLVFEHSSVRLYIVIGTCNPSYTCSRETYGRQTAFSMETDASLAKLVLPFSKDNAVYVFHRI